MSQEGSIQSIRYSLDMERSKLIVYYDEMGKNFDYIDEEDMTEYESYLFNKLKLSI